MHETGIVRDLVRRLQAVAEEAGAGKVCGASVWLGALSQFSAGHFREHFDEEARGTLAADAVLQVIVSEDFSHPDALYVRLQSVTLDLDQQETAI